MMAHIEKTGAKSDKSLGAETIEFLWHKFKGLIPYLISVFAYGLIIHYIFLRDSLSASESYNYFVTAFGELFLLRMSGLKVQVLNGNLWYISAMLIVMLALYPIAKRLGDRFTHIIAPLFNCIIRIGKIFPYSNNCANLFLNHVSPVSLTVTGAIQSSVFSTYVQTSSGRTFSSFVELALYPIKFPLIQILFFTSISPSPQNS